MKFFITVAIVGALIFNVSLAVPVDQAATYDIHDDNLETSFLSDKEGSFGKEHVTRESPPHTSVYGKDGEYSLDEILDTNLEHELPKRSPNHEYGAPTYKSKKVLVRHDAKHEKKRDLDIKLNKRYDAHEVDKKVGKKKIQVSKVYKSSVDKYPQVEIRHHVKRPVKTYTIQRRGSDEKYSGSDSNASSGEYGGRRGVHHRKHHGGLIRHGGSYRESESESNERVYGRIRTKHHKKKHHGGRSRSQESGSAEKRRRQSSSSESGSREHGYEKLKRRQHFRKHHGGRRGSHERGSRSHERGSSYERGSGERVHRRMRDRLHHGKHHKQHHGKHHKQHHGKHHRRGHRGSSESGEYGRRHHYGQRRHHETPGYKVKEQNHPNVDYNPGTVHEEREESITYKESESHEEIKEDDYHNREVDESVYESSKREDHAVYNEDKQEVVRVDDSNDREFPYKPPGVNY